MRWLLCVLAACTHAKPPLPDAGLDGSVDAFNQADSGVVLDADHCFETRIVQCQDMLIELCIPFSGCEMYTCNNQTYAYCHEG